MTRQPTHPFLATLAGRYLTRGVHRPDQIRAGEFCALDHAERCEREGTAAAAGIVSGSQCAPLGDITPRLRERP